jgi:hypothetical protein
LPFAACHCSLPSAQCLVWSCAWPLQSPVPVADEAGDGILECNVTASPFTASCHGPASCALPTCPGPCPSMLPLPASGAHEAWQARNATWSPSTFPSPHHHPLLGDSCATFGATYRTRTLEFAVILNARQPRMEKPGPYCVIGGPPLISNSPFPLSE